MTTSKIASLMQTAVVVKYESWGVGVVIRITYHLTVSVVMTSTAMLCFSAKDLAVS